MFGLTAAAGLVPGGGAERSDCYAELEVNGITNPGDVKRNKVVLCTDGEACDAGECGDDRCDVRVALCVNQTNLSACTPPSSLERVRVRSRGRVKLAPVPPEGPLVGSACGVLVDGTIPLRMNRRGRVLGPGKAKVMITAKAPPGTKPRTDRDEITVKCLPRTDDCPSPTTTTTPGASTTTTTTPPACGVRAWGTSGTDGQFDVPAAVATDASGHVYVADVLNSRIQKFDASGTFVTKWGTPGTLDGQFDSPSGVATDASGYVYVADSSNSRVQKFACP
jgi:hypothetical protein